MKRSPALIELSREHHTALSLALRARLVADNGDAAAIEAMAAKVTERFASELKPHFDEEERWLLPALAECGASALVARTQDEHAEIADLAARLRTPSAAALLAFAESLIRHVRFEERELFQVAESHPDCLSRHVP